MVHADAHNLQRSLRFLADPMLEYVAWSTAETAIDTFIDDVLQDAGADCDGLGQEYRALCDERADAAASRWRRLEAMLGFDPDGAPEGVVAGYETMRERFGDNSIEEAALAQQGAHSLNALQTTLAAAEASKVILRTLSTIGHIELAGLRPSKNPPGPDGQRMQPDCEAEPRSRKLDHRQLRPPWRLAVDAAGELRQRLSVPPGPIRNPRLGEVLGIHIDRLATQRNQPPSVPYGLRVRDASGNVNRLALRSRWAHSRRFELCRSLGDIIWSGNDPLGPLSAAGSGRQKFQRAFAQEFLCPVDDLRAYIPNENPTDDDIHAAARHFHVSERLIQTALVNHDVIDQETFDQMVEAA